MGQTNVQSFYEKNYEKDSPIIILMIKYQNRGKNIMKLTVKELKKMIREQIEEVKEEVDVDEYESTKRRTVYRVEIGYNATSYFSSDEQAEKVERMLDKLAHQFGGYETGSGMGMGKRDLSYSGFKTEDAAERFEAAALKLLKKARML